MTATPTDNEQTLSHLAWLDIRGADSAHFLQRQLTAPVIQLAQGEQRLAAWCNNHGQVLAVLWLGRLGQDHFRVVLAASLVETVQKGLGRYVLRDDVNLTAGVGRLTGSTTADSEDSWAHPLRDGAWLQFHRAGSNDTSEQQAMSAADWRRGDLEAGLAWLEPEQSGRWLPQMLAHDQLGLVDFHKGCYPGQEIIARAHFLGRVKRGLALLSGDGELDPQQRRLLDDEGQAAGELIEWQQRDGHWLGLAVVSMKGAGESARLDDTNHTNIRYLKLFSAKLEQA